jgi:hypothetical protein
MTTKPPLLHTKYGNKQTQHSHERMGIIKPQKKNRQVITELQRNNCTHTNPYTTKQVKAGITKYLSILTLNVAPTLPSKETSWQTGLQRKTNNLFTTNSALGKG